MRILKKGFPSFICIFIILLICSGILVACEADQEHESGWNYWDSFYFCWSIVHKVPYGELIPQSNFGKFISSIICLIGLAYQPYILALVALRRPTQEEHDSLLHSLRKKPLDPSIIGRGYMLPVSQDEVHIELPQSSSKKV
jgi:hypothetical protein